MSELRGVKILQNEIVKSRDKLKNFNDNIKKLTGVENPGPRARRILSGEDPDYDGRLGRGRGRLFGVAKRGLMEDRGPAAKRRVLGGAFSRLGPPPASARRREREDSPYDEELPNKLSLQSSVVATSREAKNRDEIMQEQTKDKEGMQRNRRMFGLLLGTLNKFKTESKTLESKEEQRKRIDKKLEENAEKERQKFKQETKQLMEEMHLEETKISRLEQKMEVVQEHSEWEREVKRLKNFICTKAKPKIFWLPCQMNSHLENKLKESNKIVDDILKEGHVRLEKEIQDVMEREIKREERIKMRLREDGLFQEDDKGDSSSKGNDPEQRENLNNFVESRTLEHTASIEEPKLKQKRRVVLDEESSVHPQSDDEEIDRRIQSQTQSLKRNKGSIEEVAGKKKKSKKESESDSSSSDSSGSEDDNENGPGGVRQRYEEENQGVSSSKGGDKERSKSKEKGLDVDQAESTRIVLHRSSSRDKDKSGKEKHHRDRKGHGKDRDGRKSSDKHSSHHSKRSRKDNERVVVKQEEESEEHKKKSSAREKDQSDSSSEEEAPSVKGKPTNLLGENEDVEMESEHNITMEK